MSQIGPGITQALATPQIVPAIERPRGPSDAARFLQAAGRDLSYGLRTLAADARRSEAKHNAVFKGEGQIQGEEDWAVQLDRIETGVLKPGATTEDNITIADQAVEEGLGQFDTEVGKTAYRDILHPAVLKRLEVARKEAAKEQLAKLNIETANALAGETDPDEIQKVFDYRRDTLDLDTAANYAGVVAIMKRMASRGSEGEASFNALAASLPPEYELIVNAEKETLRLNIEQEKAEVRQQRQTDTTADFTAMHDGLLTPMEVDNNIRKRYPGDENRDMRETKLAISQDEIRALETRQREEANRTDRDRVDIALQQVNKALIDGDGATALTTATGMVEDGALTSTQAKSVVTQAKVMIAAKDRQNRRAIAQINSDILQEQWLSEAGRHLDAGNQHLIPEDGYSIVLDDGTQEGKAVKLNKEDAIKTIVNLRMEQIAAVEDDPTIRLAKQAAYLSRIRGVYGLFREMIVSSASTSLVEFIGKPTTPEDGAHNGKVTAKAEMAFRIKMMLDNVSGVLGDDHSDIPSRDLFDLAEAAFKHGPNPGDYKSALATALRILTNPEEAERRAGAVRQQSRKIAILAGEVDLSFWWGGVVSVDFKNISDIRDAIINKAEYYTMAGIGADAGIEMALEKVTRDMVNVNGYAVFPEGSNLPIHLVPVAAEAAIAQYMAANADVIEDAGWDADDISIRPLGNGTWILINGATGDAVPRWESEGMFSNQAMTEFVPEEERIELYDLYMKGVGVRERGRHEREIGSRGRRRERELDFNP